MPSLFSRLRSGWNAFMNKDPTVSNRPNYNHEISYIRPDGPVLSKSSERTLITSVYNRIAVDFSSVKMHHVKLDENDRYLETIYDGLEECLNVSANIDQTGTAFRRDVCISLLDEGNIAIAPIDTDDRPEYGTKFDILSLRVGKIVKWNPDSVELEVYNERKGKRENIVMSKGVCTIVENPFYAIMNQPNSTAKRIMRKLTLLDYVDEQNGSGKLDLIVQLPYVIKTPGRESQAEERRKSIEMQLQNSKYGIAYIDGTEKIVQLNRSIENQLLPQIKDLKYELFSQLGITEEIMNGTANQETLNNYYQRTIVPILTEVSESMIRTFLTKEARDFKEVTTENPETGETDTVKEKESIMFFNDPFKLIPTNQLAEIADKFTRNEIMTSNEIRQAIGMIPSKDPKADELRNSNISAAKDMERFDKNGNDITNILGKE